MVVLAVAKIVTNARNGLNRGEVCQAFIDRSSHFEVFVYHGFFVACARMYKVTFR